MTTELIAPGTSLYDSADITGPFQLYIKPASGNVPAPPSAYFWLQKKNSTGGYNTIAVLTADNVRKQGAVSDSGTYRVERQSSAFSAGMDWEVLVLGGS